MCRRLALASRTGKRFNDSVLAPILGGEVRGETGRLVHALRQRNLLARALLLFGLEPWSVAQPQHCAGMWGSRRVSVDPSFQSGEVFLGVYTSITEGLSGRRQHC